MADTVTKSHEIQIARLQTLLQYVGQRCSAHDVATDKYVKGTVVGVRAKGTQAGSLLVAFDDDSEGAGYDPYDVGLAARGA